uniref:Uncharacterized protein n=1 Tax=Anguilla anguilla TaxID=7936 RepID=A0A0E9SGZ9_ANGAN
MHSMPIAELQHPGQTCIHQGKSWLTCVNKFKLLSGNHKCLLLRI